MFLPLDALDNRSREKTLHEEGQMMTQVEKLNY